MAKRKGKSKKVGIISAFVLGIAALAGAFVYFRTIATNIRTPYEKASLVYWGIGIDEEVMDVMIDKYRSVNPNVEIDYVDRNYEDDLFTYRNLLYQRLVQGKGPSIFRIHSTWVSSYLSQLAKNPGDMDYKEYSDRFFRAAVNACLNPQGDIFCLPLSYDGLVLLYNKDFFNEASLSPPSTWDELLTSAKKLTFIDDKGRIIRTGVALGRVDNVRNATDILSLMFYQSQLNIPDSFDTEAAYKVVNYYSSFDKLEKVWSASMPDSVVAFADQKVAMIFAKQSDIEELLELNPTLNFGISQVPQIPTYDGGRTNNYLGSFYVEGVSNDLSETEQLAAWKFLDWLTEEQQQQEMYQLQTQYKRFGELPSNKKLYLNFKELTFIGPILENADFARTSIISDNVGNDVYVKTIKDLFLLRNFNNKEITEYLTKAKGEFKKLQSQ